MAISEKEVQNLAALAQLELSASEQKKFTEELGQILSFVSQLQSVDTTGVAPEGALAPMTEGRRDEAVVSDNQAILDAVPATEGGAVKSPRILT